MLSVIHLKSLVITFPLHALDVAVTFLCMDVYFSPHMEYYIA